MNINEMTLTEFTDFASTHAFGNFHQSINYALLKAEEGFEYEFISYGGDEIIAAALILYKKIGNFYYGYSPRGFLIDYSNIFYLKDFTAKLKDYYKDKGFAFIKINPEIAISKLDKETMTFTLNDNIVIKDNLVACGYKPLKSNMNFEALLPRVNAIVNLKDFEYSKLNKNTRNKIRKGYRKGLTLEVVSQDKLNIFYNFIKNKRNKDEYYYNDLYNVFSKTEDIDLFLVKIDYKKFLINSQEYYDRELNINNNLNNKLIGLNITTSINAKMNSDRALLTYKNDVAEASKYLNVAGDTYIAGAMVIKHQNRVTIQISGFDKTMSRYAPNYFLYYAILMHYKNDFKYADLNGIAADFAKDSKYYGLNRFKLGFNPDVYEYIGEFDLPIDDVSYNALLKSGLLAKEFNK